MAVNLCADFTNLPACRPHATLNLQDYIPEAIHPQPRCGFLDNGTLVCVDTGAPGAVVERGAACVVVWVNPRCECDRHTLHEVPSHVLGVRHDVVLGANAGAVCYIKVKRPCRRLVFSA